MLITRDEANLTLTATKDRGLPIRTLGATFSYENNPQHELATARFWGFDPGSIDTEEQAQLESDIVEYLRRFPNLTANAVHKYVGGNRKVVLDTLRRMRNVGMIAEKKGPGLSMLLYVPPD